MYTLFYSPGSASMVVHLALLEIGAPYKLQRVDFAAGAQRDPTYLELNPDGTVPTLLIDGKPVDGIRSPVDDPGRAPSRRASCAGSRHR